MQRLVLIKHAQPRVDPQVPTHLWGLSDDGKAKAQLLAGRIEPLGAELIFTSGEPKAQQTAELLGLRLSRPVQELKGLEEHDRTNVPHMASRDFISYMALFFQRPRQLVLGNETAEGAGRRIQRAIFDAVEQAAGKGLAIVTHGTVLALFAGPYLESDPFQIWRRMGQPSYLVLELPEWRVAEFVEKLE